MKLLLIAFKNLQRHKVKSILTILAVTVGIALYIFTDSWLYGMDLDSRRNLVSFETGSSKIYSKEYFEKKGELPMYESFGNYKSILDDLDKIGYDGAPHAVFSGELMSQTQELPFLFIGIDPVQEKKIFRYNKYLEEGTWLNNNEFKALLGVKGAKDLNVKIGDGLRLSTTIDIKDEYEKIHHVHQLIDITVGGIINSPNPKNNGYIAYLPLGILQDKMGIMLNGKITEISIRIKNANDNALPVKKESPEFLVSQLGTKLPKDLILVSWKEDAKDFLAITRTKQAGNKIIIIILILLSLFGIANTMLMAVLERTKEIGMLRALGMIDSQIFCLITYEAFLIGLIGTFIGIIIGSIGTYWSIIYGIDLTNFMTEMDMENIGYRIVGIFKGAWHISVILGCAFLGPLISALVAMGSAKKSIRMSIVDALDFE
jgi:ABC-type lipoprotein release transport system permease subunit